MATSLLATEFEYPSLFVFLRTKYQEAMQQRNAELRESHGNKPGEPPQIDVAAALQQLETFGNFAEDFLTRHRPVELFYPESNFGIKLDNGEAFLVAPPTASIRGTMQPSSYAPITGGRYVDELAGQGAFAITGRKQPIPKGATDMSLPTAVVDKTKGTGVKNYDK